MFFFDDRRQGEITSLSHCPPSFVVTGGSDGSICVWNVISGHFRAKLVCKQFEQFAKRIDHVCNQVKLYNIHACFFKK